MDGDKNVMKKSFIERRAIQDDIPHIFRTEKNISIRQMTCVMGKVIFGKDHVELIKNYRQEE